MSGSLADQLWVSVGVQYNGGNVGHDSVTVFSMYMGDDRDGGMQALLQPLSGEYTPDQLANNGITRQEVRRHGQQPATVIARAMMLITRRSHGRDPILICADPLAEQHVRWYFAAHGGFDPFTQSDEAQRLSAEWNHNLRSSMDQWHDYKCAMGLDDRSGELPASATARDQFEMLVWLLGRMGHF